MLSKRLKPEKTFETEAFPIDDRLQESKSDVFEWDGLKPHPLLIPHIIENIYDNLFGTKVNTNVHELRVCRLVCSQWKDVATKLYQKHSEELVFGETYGSDTQKVKKFLADMLNSRDNPVHSYRFDPAFFVQQNEPLFKDFMYSCTQWIVTLKLWFDNESDLRFAKRCYPDLKLEALDYLFFGCVNYRGTCSSEKMELTYILETLLGAATNLRKFCFSFPPKDIRSQQAIIKRFGDLITTKCPHTVKNLKLEMKLTDAQVESLTGIGLSLDALHCDFRGSTLSSNVIHNLLAQQQTSLQEMRLLDSEIKYNFELRFPRFEKLTVFEIQGGTIEEFSYNNQFPVLERLLLFGWENVHTSKSMFESKTPCGTLMSLELPYKIQDESLINLATECFPNLKKLEITPTHEGMNVLAKVFASLGQLEELEITFPFIIDVELNVDPIFTGIPLADCEHIWNTETELNNVNFSAMQKKQSIANLKKLKKLTILDHSNEIKLTDITALFGLMQLESLQVLEMGRFNISGETFAVLQNKVRVTENCDSSDSENSFFSDSCSDNSLDSNAALYSTSDYED